MKLGYRPLRKALTVALASEHPDITVALAVPTEGGWDTFRSLDLDEDEEQVKGEAGVLAGMHVVNLSDGVRYLKVFNAAAADVTVGTTVPVMTLPIPTLGDTNGAGFLLPPTLPGIEMDTAITLAATTGLADNDSGAPGANEVVINVWYR